MKFIALLFIFASVVASSARAKASKPNILIFYLVLRALDTIEDDMTYFQTIAAEKEEEEAAAGVGGMTTDPTTTTNNNNSTQEEEDKLKNKYYKEEGNKLKIQTLLSFHQTALFDPHWKLMGF